MNASRDTGVGFRGSPPGRVAHSSRGGAAPELVGGDGVVHLQLARERVEPCRLAEEVASHAITIHVTSHASKCNRMV